MPPLLERRVRTFSRLWEERFSLEASRSMWLSAAEFMQDVGLGSITEGHLESSPVLSWPCLGKFAQELLPACRNPAFWSGQDPGPKAAQELPLLALFWSCSVGGKRDLVNFGEDPRSTRCWGRVRRGTEWSRVSNNPQVVQTLWGSPVFVGGSWEPSRPADS